MRATDLRTVSPSFGLMYRPSIIQTYIPTLHYLDLCTGPYYSELCTGFPSFRLMYWPSLSGLNWPSIVRTYVPALIPSFGLTYQFGFMYQPSLFGLIYRPAIIWRYVPTRIYSDLRIRHHHYSNLRTGSISSESHISLSAFKPFMQGSSFSKQTRCQYLFM